MLTVLAVAERWPQKDWYARFSLPAYFRSIRLAEQRSWARVKGGTIGKWWCWWSSHDDDDASDVGDAGRHPHYSHHLRHLRNHRHSPPQNHHPIASSWHDDLWHWYHYFSDNIFLSLWILFYFSLLGLFCLVLFPKHEMASKSRIKEHLLVGKNVLVCAADQITHTFYLGGIWTYDPRNSDQMS